MRVFTTGEVLEITGLPPNTFTTWCQTGIVRPLNDVSGKGNHRVFDTMTVVGLAVAAELRAQPQGCQPEYVGAIVSAFGKMSESKLLKTFERDGTGFVMVSAGGIPVLRTKQYDWPDVRAIYRKVVEVAEG